MLHFRTTLQVLQASIPIGTLLPVSIDKELTSADFALEVLKVVLYSYEHTTKSLLTQENGLSKLLLDEIKIIGVLSVEHDPQCKKLGNSDGVCLTLLVSCDAAAAAKLEGGYWVTVEDKLVVERLRNAMVKGTSCIQLCSH